MIKESSLLLALATVGGCSDGMGPNPPPPETAPTVDISVGFGDSPVAGTVMIRRQNLSEPWLFSVDIDSNGDADATGPIGSGADVPFEFASPGVHRILVELSLEGNRFETERLVIVNDLTASEVIRTVPIPVDDEPVVSLEGITIGGGGTGLELYVAMSLARRVFRLDPSTLEVQAEISLASENVGTLEGMDLDPAGGFLYVVSKNQSLISLTASDLTLSQILGVSGTAFTVYALSPGMVLSGGEGTVSLVDTNDGTIVNARQIRGAVNFAVSSDGTMLGLIQRLDDGGQLIRFLAVPSLDDLESTNLPAGFLPKVVAFKPSQEKLYVLGEEPVVSGRARLITIEVATGQIVADQVLEACGLCLSFTIANPYADSFDGRFVVFPTALGAYIVDVNLDLPIHRTGFSGCCNVASSPTTNEFYFANTAGEVSIVRLNR
ncbi:MAG: YncE family protein [Gemmatimonadota bacterium]